MSTAKLERAGRIQQDSYLGTPGTASGEEQGQSAIPLNTHFSYFYLLESETDMQSSPVYSVECAVLRKSFTLDREQWRLLLLGQVGSCFTGGGGGNRVNLEVSPIPGFPVTLLSPGVSPPPSFRMSLSLTVQITSATSRPTESILQTPSMNASFLGWRNTRSINEGEEKF